MAGCDPIWPTFGIVTFSGGRRRSCASPDDDAGIPARDAVTDEDPVRLEIRMIHVHLPKLDDAGVVEWDRETTEVRKGPASTGSGRC